MQVDPANVPLPTLSTDSSMLPPDQPTPASPRTCAFVEHLQRQIIHQTTTGERGRTTTRVLQDLCNALADMFGLPLLPIPQSPPARSPSPMAAISTSQSHHDKLCHSLSAPSIPISTINPCHQTSLTRTRARPLQMTHHLRPQRSCTSPPSMRHATSLQKTH